MRILLLNQAFYPDVVSSAQHASDLARILSERGHDVTVVCGRRAYDNPACEFAAREVWNGIRIIRIRSTGFGKSGRLARTLDFGSFLASSLVRLLLMGRFDVVMAMTSPPLLSFIASLYSLVYRSRLLLWIMDLNPDQAIAAGWLSASSRTGRVLRSLLSISLQRASQVIVLDRFMRGRIADKGVPVERIVVIPPWSHDEAIAFDGAGRERFRAAHGLTGRFVVMYSGNHSPCHPLDTLLGAAKELASRPDIAFCFIGGGSEFRKVQEFARRNGLRNIVCLPYQPLETLRESLSAADLHSIVMGDPFVGMIHPCKIYNVLALGTPFLYIGPPESHVEDLISADGLRDWSFSLRHGDVYGLVANVVQAAQDPRSQISTIVMAAEQFSMRELTSKMAALFETVGSPAGPPIEITEGLPQSDEKAKARASAAGR